MFVSNRYIHTSKSFPWICLRFFFCRIYLLFSATLDRLMQLSGTSFQLPLRILSKSVADIEPTDNKLISHQNAIGISRHSTAIVNDFGSCFHYYFYWYSRGGPHITPNRYFQTADADVLQCNEFQMCEVSVSHTLISYDMTAWSQMSIKTASVYLAENKQTRLSLSPSSSRVCMK